MEGERGVQSRVWRCYVREFDRGLTKSYGSRKKCPRKKDPGKKVPEKWSPGKKVPGKKVPGKKVPAIGAPVKGKIGPWKKGPRCNYLYKRENWSLEKKSPLYLLM